MPKSNSEQAIKKFASPDRLDTMISVVKPMGWHALVLFGLVTLVFLIWSIFMKLPVMVQGQGILMKDNLTIVQAEKTGLVAIQLKEGDLVKAGDVVARIKVISLQPELYIQENRLKQLKQTNDAIAQKNALLDSQHKNLSEQLSTAEKALGEKAREIARIKDQMDNKLKTQRDLDTALEEKRQLENEISTSKFRIDENTKESIASSKQTDAEEARLYELKLEVYALSKQVTEGVEIVSPKDGKVVELKVDNNALVEAHSALFSMENENQNSTLVGEVYVPAADAKRIAVNKDGVPIYSNARVQLSPSTVKREEAGTMVGRIQRVDQYPATPEGMLRVLKNRAMAEKLSKDGPLIKVTVALVDNLGNPSGFQWSSGKGPAVQITSGTLCSGMFEVERKTPISYVFAFLRRLTTLQ